MARRVGMLALPRWPLSAVIVRPLSRTTERADKSYGPNAGSLVSSKADRSLNSRPLILTAASNPCVSVGVATLPSTVSVAPAACASTLTGQGRLRSVSPLSEPPANETLKGASPYLPSISSSTGLPYGANALPLVTVIGANLSVLPRRPLSSTTL